MRTSRPFSALSLRFLFGVVALASVPLARLAYIEHEGHRVIEEIERRGGSVVTQSFLPGFHLTGVRMPCANSRF